MRLSTIVCAYNEEKGIRNLLVNLINQRLPPEIEDDETIIVTSGCTDGTVKIVKDFMITNPRIRLIEEEVRLGKASAINKALKAAKGEVLVFVPADVQPAEDGLFHLLQPFKNPSVMVVSGQPVQHPKARVKGLIGYIGDMTYRIWGRLMRSLNDMGLAAHSSGEFMAVRAGVVDSIPEECAADDAYISIMARRKGFVKYAGEAVAYNVMPSNLREYINQRRRWLFGHFQTQRLTGEFPTVMDTIIFTRTRAAFEILIRILSEDLKKTPYLMTALVVEAVIYLLSIYDSLIKKEYGIWPVIKTTKILPDSR